MLYDLHPHLGSLPVVAGLLTGGQGSGILPGECVHRRLAAHAGDHNCTTVYNKLRVNVWIKLCKLTCSAGVSCTLTFSVNLSKHTDLMTYRVLYNLETVL